MVLLRRHIGFGLHHNARSMGVRHDLVHHAKPLLCLKVQLQLESELYLSRYQWQYGVHVAHLIVPVLQFAREPCVTSFERQKLKIS